jgi:hypothetical protein
MMRRVGRRQSCPVKAATGERIVAFGRVGKPPKTSFLWSFRARKHPGGPVKTSGIRNDF